MAILVLLGIYLVLRATVFAPKPIPVRVISVERGRVERTVTNSKAGTVKARLRAQLSPESSGRVVEISHRKGEMVKQGELLIRLNDLSQRAQLAQAKSNFEAAQALHREACFRSERAASELERNRKLAADEVVSMDLVEQLQSNFDALRQSCESTLAKVEQASAAIEVAQAELAKTAIFAPFDGVIAELTTELGEWISPAPAMMVVPATVDLINTSSIYLSAPMDEVDSTVIQKGQAVRAMIDPFPQKQFAGHVVRVAPFVLDIESQNRTVEIEVELEDRAFAAQLLPGTSADVEVILEVRDNVLRIPTSSVLQGNKVLVAQNGALEERSVTTGVRNWAYCEIVDGLAEKESVVTSLDRAEIKAGAVVSISKENSSK